MILKGKQIPLSHSCFCIRPVSFSSLPLAESFIINSFVLEAEMAGPGRAGGRSAAPASVLFKGLDAVAGKGLILPSGAPARPKASVSSLTQRVSPSHQVQPRLLGWGLWE